MAKDDVIVVDGKVIEALPNAMFRVELDNDMNVAAALNRMMFWPKSRCYFYFNSIIR